MQELFKRDEIWTFFFIKLLNIFLQTPFLNFIPPDYKIIRIDILTVLVKILCTYLHKIKEGSSGDFNRQWVDFIAKVVSYIGRNQKPVELINILEI